MSGRFCLEDVAILDVQSSIARMPRRLEELAFMPCFRCGRSTQRVKHDFTDEALRIFARANWP